MKNRILVSMLVALFVLTFAANTASARYSHNISGDLLNYLEVDRFDVTYEHQLSAMNSFTIIGSWYDYSSYFDIFGLGASYRWYPKLFEDGKKSLEGFSVGPMITMVYWKYSYLSRDDTYITFNIGGEAAYKWVFNGFSVEPKITLLIQINKPDNFSTWKGVSLGCNLGYAW